ncbi:MAG TPA: Gldg family protein [Bacteroidia bacterium]|jgi:gliding-associated putative ABC transporter substrate-binding component GldG|nr:Gldg family protein [Bacteroidia bacterium]
MKKRQNLTTGVLLMVAIILVVNVFSYFYFFRIDFTKDRRYTLSQPTKDILASLTKPVTITAYYSENSIPAISRARADLKDMLTEYAARSGNKVVFNFINPNKNDSLEKIAQRNGVSPFPVQVREKDEMKNVKVYLGAVVKMGDKTDVLPLIDPNGSLEFTLSNSIKKLSIDKKPLVGLLEGNGEPALTDMQQVEAAVDALHTMKEIKLSGNLPIPADYNTLALISPKDTFSPGQLQQLDAFLARGGQLLIGYSGLTADLRNGVGRLGNNINLAGWLAEKGIVLDNKYVIDARCGNVTVPQNGMNFNVSFPFLPMIGNFANHPVTKDLRSVLLTFASDILFTGDTNKVKFTPLAFTSDKSGLETIPAKFDLEHKWEQSEFPFANLVVAAAVSGVDGNKNARIIIVANNDFAVNGSGKQAMKLEQDNVDLFANSVDWLSDNTGLIELRSKVAKFVPIKDVSDGEKLFLKYFNFSFPILLVIIYGIIRMQVKKRIRTKRMEEIYD